MSSDLPRISFYHLTATPLDAALPKVLERVLSSGARAVVLTGSRERAEHLDSVLWTYDPDSFLPHGTVKTGYADQQPIWLTDQPENPNQATMLAIVDGADFPYPNWPGLSRILDFFDARDEMAVQAARERYKAARAAGHALDYFKQTPQGRWEKG